MNRFLSGLLLMSISSVLLAQEADDPYLWLEDVGGDKALAWVHAQNAVTVDTLQAAPGFKALKERFVSVLDSRDRIPYVDKLGRWYYNFWRDSEHVRGVWRRTTLEQYRMPAPRWETVLDLDALAAKEGESWVWKSAQCLYPRHERCLLSLSRGGGDAVVVREFNVQTKAFVDDGFRLPEAKSDVAWRSANSIYVATDFGPGSMTTSGYPRELREWKRGGLLADARHVYTAPETDVGIGVSTVFDRGYPVRELVQRSKTFFTHDYFLREGAELRRIDVPDDASIDIARDWLFVTLRTAWTVGGREYGQGALLVTPLQSYLRGERHFDVLFEPAPRRSLASFTVTRSHVLVEELDNVRDRVREFSYVGGRWTSRELDLPKFGDISVTAVDRNESDRYWVRVTGFLTPPSLYLAHAGSERRERLKSLPAFFDTTGLVVEQLQTQSKDGTVVPYFVVRHEAQPLDGSAPTVLYGYGGFEVSLQPGYSALIGNGWLARGGTWVLANIRGGGEFGPQWHQAALKEHRQRAFDDFIAVAEDLIARRITSPRHLGIVGGSNGGLLVGAVMVQRPELFGAVVAQVPLLDMKRYNKLLAGASWMGEYGDPDKPEEWAYISQYSPYQKVRREVVYPKLLLTTTTRDDRVHPGHARKMFARMKEQGHDVLYFENTEGGHAAGSNTEQQALSWALTYTFLWQSLH